MGDGLGGFPKLPKRPPRLRSPKSAKVPGGKKLTGKAGQLAGKKTGDAAGSGKPSSKRSPFRRKKNSQGGLKGKLKKLTGGKKKQPAGGKGGKRSGLKRAAAVAKKAAKVAIKTVKWARRAFKAARRTMYAVKGAVAAIGGWWVVLIVLGVVALGVGFVWFALQSALGDDNFVVLPDDAALGAQVESSREQASDADGSSDSGTGTGDDDVLELVYFGGLTEPPDRLLRFTDPWPVLVEGVGGSCSCSAADEECEFGEHGIRLEAPVAVDWEPPDELVGENARYPYCHLLAAGLLLSDYRDDLSGKLFDNQKVTRHLPYEHRGDYEWAGYDWLTLTALLSDQNVVRAVGWCPEQGTSIDYDALHELAVSEEIIDSMNKRKPKLLVFSPCTPADRVRTHFENSDLWAAGTSGGWCADRTDQLEVVEGTYKTWIEARETVRQLEADGPPEIELGTADNIPDQQQADEDDSEGEEVLPLITAAQNLAYIKFVNIQIAIARPGTRPELPSIREWLQRQEEWRQRSAAYLAEDEQTTPSATAAQPTESSAVDANEDAPVEENDKPTEEEVAAARVAAYHAQLAAARAAERAAHAAHRAAYRELGEWWPLWDRCISQEDAEEMLSDLDQASPAWNPVTMLLQLGGLSAVDTVNVRDRPTFSGLSGMARDDIVPLLRAAGAGGWLFADGWPSDPADQLNDEAKVRWHGCDHNTWVNGDLEDRCSEPRAEDLPDQWLLGVNEQHCPTKDHLDRYFDRGIRQVQRSSTVPVGTINPGVAPCLEAGAETLLVAARVVGLTGNGRNDGKLAGGGYRSHEDQARWCVGWPDSPERRCSNNPPRAWPGRSRHQHGLAVDFTWRIPALDSMDGWFHYDYRRPPTNPPDEFTELPPGELADTGNSLGGAEGLLCSVDHSQSGLTFEERHLGLCHKFLARFAPLVGLHPLSSEPWHWSVDGR